MAATIITPAFAHVGDSLSHLYKHLDKRYQQIPTTTQHYTIAGSTYVDADSVGREDGMPTGDAWCTRFGSGSDFYAPVHLPQGVTVTGFKVEYVDDSGTTNDNGTVYLTRFALMGKGGDYSDMYFAGLADTTAPGDGIKVAGTVSNTTALNIDNTEEAYTVIGQLGSANPWICNIEVLYTVHKPFDAVAGPGSPGLDANGSLP